MKNIELSRTFSASVIIILLGIFVLPSLYSGYALNKMDESEEAFYERQSRNDHNLMASVDKLGLIDNGLKNCITYALHKYKGIPASNSDVSDVFQLKQLDCFRHKIKSLEGIAQLADLQYLDLSYNPVKDLYPLLRLKKLETLNLDQVRLADFNMLHNFDRLQFLKLPNVETVLCSDLNWLIDSKLYEIDGVDYAKSKCLKDAE